MNPSATRLALQGKNKIVVVAITQKTKLEIQNGVAQIQCRSRLIEERGRNIAPIRKVAWHPLSDSHLVTMTQDMLRFFHPYFWLIPVGSMTLNLHLLLQNKNTEFLTITFPPNLLLLLLVDLSILIAGRSLLFIF